MELFNTWKKVMFDPVNFYHNLSEKEGYAEANKYFLKVQAITTAIVMLMIGIVVAGIAAMGAPGITLTGVFLMLIVFYPFILLFSWGMLYVGAGIYHLMVLLVGGKKKYLETFKVTAYAVSPSIFSIIPFVSYVVAIYALILQVIGIKERQQLSWTKSIVVILVPTAILITVAIILFIKYMPAMLPPVDLTNITANVTLATNNTLVN